MDNQMKIKANIRANGFKRIDRPVELAVNFTEGRLFWSHGIGMSVLFDEQATPITEREHYFTGLPDAALCKDFYGTHAWTQGLQGFQPECGMNIEYAVQKRTKEGKSRQNCWKKRPGIGGKHACRTRYLQD